MRWLSLLARACALLGGALLLAVAAVSCASVLGRNTTGWTLLGDFELTGVATGAAIALAMPWCQLRNGHLRVDFFTARAAAATRERLDRLGALLMALVLGLMAWRTGLGAASAWASHASTMMLGFPEWLAHAAMAAPLALAGVIALVQALRGAQAFEPGAAGSAP